jgi:lysophospholipase L1-like esterase
VVVLGLLPTSWRGVGEDVVPQTNEQYAELAARHGAAYVDCGADLDPTDPYLFKDGLHPASMGQDIFLSCVRLQLQRYLA